MTLTAFLQTVAGALEDAGVPYMLTGSLAAAFYAVPRATQDVDVVIEAEQAGLDRLVDRLSELGWYVDRQAAQEAWDGQGQFNAIDPESGWKADFIVRKQRPFSREEFARRQRISILGVELSVARLEDVVLAKLEWAHLGDSALQRQDVLHLLERTWPRLNQAYLQKWVAELALEAEWNEVRARMTSTDSER